MARGAASTAETRAAARIAPRRNGLSRMMSSEVTNRSMQCELQRIGDLAAAAAAGRSAEKEELVARDGGRKAVPPGGQRRKGQPTIVLDVVSLDLIVGLAHVALTPGDKEQAMIFRERRARARRQHRRAR